MIGQPAVTLRKPARIEVLFESKPLIKDVTNGLVPCRILAELPRSLSEVALPGGVSPASMDGPVRLDN